MAERRILLVSYYFPPLGGVGAFRAVKLARYLPRLGWRPVVLAPLAPYYYCIDPTLADEIEKEIRVVRTESADPFRLFGRLRRARADAVTDGAGSDRLFGRLTRAAKRINTWLFVPDNSIGWYPFAARAACRVIREEKIDVVYTINVPQTCHLIGRAAKRATGARWVADFRDAWTANPDLPAPTALHAGANRRLERSVLDEADGIVAVNDTVRDLLFAAAGGRRAERFVTIHNGYDPEDFVDLPVRRFERFTMVFAGTFHKRTDPRLLLEPYRECLRSGRIPAGASRIVVVGAQTARTEAAVRALGLEKEVELTGFLAHRESLSWMASADLLLQVIAAGPGSDQIVSGKLYEYLAAGKPVLSIGPPGEARRLVQNLGAGWAADVENPREVAGALADAYERWTAGRLDSPLDRDGVERLSFGRQTKDLAAFLEGLLA
ncbi:MAG: glycosyltransferase [Candidatus Latescibacterota bacterium]|nr:MAG: glycosyltransferase [Candidatus Latescibacterota bacterium]